MSAKICYARLDEFWRKKQKYQFLEEKQHVYNIERQKIALDGKLVSLETVTIVKSLVALEIAEQNTEVV